MTGSAVDALRARVYGFGPQAANVTFLIQLVCATVVAPEDHYIAAPLEEAWRPSPQRGPASRPVDAPSLPPQPTSDDAAAPAAVC